MAILAFCLLTDEILYLKLSRIISNFIVNFRRYENESRERPMDGFYRNDEVRLTVYYQRHIVCLNHVILIFLLSTG